MSVWKNQTACWKNYSVVLIASDCCDVFGECNALEIPVCLCVVCLEHCWVKKHITNPSRFSQTRVPHATVSLSPFAASFAATGSIPAASLLLPSTSSSSSFSSPSSETGIYCCAAATAPHATTWRGLNCVLRCAPLLPPDFLLGGCALRFIHSSVLTKKKHTSHVVHRQIVEARCMRNNQRKRGSITEKGRGKKKEIQHSNSA